jgi:flagellar motor switch protein FliM
MEKILNQEEIDKLFNAAQKRAPRPSSKRRSVVQECDFRQAGALTKDQVRQVTSLHENFAPNLTNSLGAYLRVGFQTSLVAVEQLVYNEFLARIPEQTYFTTVVLMPIEELAAIQIDLALIFPMIDLLLGGPGQGVTELRDLTEIEQQIIGSVMQILCRELQTTWQMALPLQFSAGERLQQAHIGSLMPAAERVLNLSFEVQITDVRGTLNLVFPGVVSNLLLRKLAQQGMTRRRRSSADTGIRLRERMLDAKFEVALELRRVPVAIRDVVDMQPGKVLPLGHSLREPMFMAINGTPVFSGLPVSCGAARGGLVQEILPPPEVVEKERS